MEFPLVQPRINCEVSEGRWQESLGCNQKAVALNPDNEAAWWNLGIAATALRDWPEARRAGKKYGVQLDEGNDEVTMPVVTGCVRLNPAAEGEVVWGERIDPARFLILNVPLPESDHRYRDIVLNDGAPSGTGEKNGERVDVFNELEVWEVSEYKTFEVDLEVPSEAAERQLTEICESTTWVSKTGPRSESFVPGAALGIRDLMNAGRELFLEFENPTH